MNIETVDLRDELRQRIQPRLYLAPVVVRAPVANQLLKLGELHALGSIIDGFFLRPPCRQDAFAKIGKRFVGHSDAEWPDGGLAIVGSGGCRWQRRETHHHAENENSGSEAGAAG